jgi:hypothetical protein
MVWHERISLLVQLRHCCLSYVGAEASDKSKLAMVLPRDVLVLSPSGWQFWQINAMSFDWRNSVLLIPNKEIEQIMIH